MQARLKGVLDGQAGLVAGLDERPLMRFNADSDFDESGRLKVGAERFSAFIA